MNEYGEETRVPYLGIKEGDVSVLVGFPLAVLVLTGIIGLDVLALPAAFAAAGFAWAVVYVTPEHVSAWTWLTHRVRHLRRPSITLSALAQATPADRSDESGGLSTYTPFTPDETTQELTNIERAWPGAGAIERSDGAMEAYLELEPGNMDFAMSDDWEAVQETAAEFANTKLDFPLKFHATTRSFPVDELVDRIEDRLTDDDVKENPRFRVLLKEYREKRPREMRERGAQQMQFYLGVEVNQLEVYNRSSVEPTPAEKLTSLPVIGVLFNPLLTRREDLAEAELRAKMFDLLEERRETIETKLEHRINGWTVRPLSTVELFMLVTEFWNGDEDVTDVEHPDRFIREQPVIGREPRDEMDHDEWGESQ